MGGAVNALFDRDISLFQQNPALLNEKMDHRALMNFNSNLGSLWSGNAAYAFKKTKHGRFGVYFTYLDYGTMDGYDEGGNFTEELKAYENALGISWSNSFKKHFTYGITAKMAYSVLGPYVGNGAMFDFGGTYTSPNKSLTASAVIKNLGMMIATYGGGPREKTPLDVQLGMSLKPEHMPARFSIVAHNLQNPDYTYNQYLINTGIIDLSGNPSSPTPATFGDKIARHFILGGEIILSEYWSIMLGYNHQRRKELAPETRKGVTGYSWGINFRISKLAISYGSSSYFPGYNMNQFTLSVGFDDFKKKSGNSQPLESSKN